MQDRTDIRIIFIQDKLIMRLFFRKMKAPEYDLADCEAKKEQEQFLDFLESFRSHLEQKGYRLDKWTR